MTTNNQNSGSNSWIWIVIILAAAAIMLWPWGAGGFKVPGGAEISSWWGKVKVKPLPPEPPLVAPATRCLIFSAKWCGPCNQLKRNVAGMSRSGWRVGSAATDDIEFIDVDGRDERLSKYKHSSIPALVIVDPTGKEIARREGVQSADELGAWIRSTRTPKGEEETDGR
jgi:hypothetical protein